MGFTIIENVRVDVDAKRTTDISVIVPGKSAMTWKDVKDPKFNDSASVHRGIEFRIGKRPGKKVVVSGQTVPEVLRVTTTELPEE